MATQGVKDRGATAEGGERGSRFCRQTPLAAGDKIGGDRSSLRPQGRMRQWDDRERGVPAAPTRGRVRLGMGRSGGGVTPPPGVGELEGAGRRPAPSWGACGEGGLPLSPRTSGRSTRSDVLPALPSPRPSRVDGGRTAACPPPGCRQNRISASGPSCRLPAGIVFQKTITRSNVTMVCTASASRIAGRPQSCPAGIG